MYRETYLRSILKSISWRFLATLTTALIVFTLTGQIETAVAAGGFEAAIKFLIHLAHERIWDKFRFGRHEIKPAVIWLTGLSGSGKSTIAAELFNQLKHKGYRAERLDGDAVRSIFPNTGFSREERDQHVRRVGFLASLLEKNGVFVVASFVSPYECSRRFVRELCGNFIEVYVSTPLEECERRDVKGLYARARRGEIKNFTGIDDPYEEPIHPELRIDTTHLSVQEAASQILRLIEQQARNQRSINAKQCHTNIPVALDSRFRTDARVASPDQ